MMYSAIPFDAVDWNHGDGGSFRYVQFFFLERLNAVSYVA